MQTSIQYIKTQLANRYHESEIEGLVRIILGELLGLTYTDIILQHDKKIDLSDFEKIKDVVARLQKLEPIQYIFGKCEFFGLEIHVNPSVLIPRPETEELVDWILKTSIGKQAKILDVGTGSGCIPLALKSNLGDANLCALDISQDALNTATLNAKKHQLDINFLLVDILKWENYNWEKFDVVVSNPPYVRELEKKQMHNNVLQYEPEGALFVADDNALVFYKAIAEFGKANLIENGYLFFEINEYLGAETKTMLKELGYRNIELRKDINGKDRMIRCQN